jgi:hypothetical protein
VRAREFAIREQVLGDRGIGFVAPVEDVVDPREQGQAVAELPGPVQVGQRVARGGRIMAQRVDVDRAFLLLLAEGVANQAVLVSAGDAARVRRCQP